MRMRATCHQEMCVTCHQGEGSLQELPSMTLEKPLLAPETKFFSILSGHGNGCEEVSSEIEEMGMKGGGYAWPC